MKQLLVGVTVLLFAQGPAAPFPNHEMPPAGWYCHPGSAHDDPAVQAKACACLGMQEKPDPGKLCAMEPEPCDQNLDDGCAPPREPNDNAQCKAFCHKDHCACMTQCEMS